MECLLEELRRFDALRDGDAGNDVVAERALDAISPTYADKKVFDRLSSALTDALHKRGVDRLYQHQAEAILKALGGKNVVLQAPTASGKSLAFQVPMIETLLHEPESGALMLYPTKALALDQRDQLNNLVNHIQGRQIDSWWYDGDTDREYRKLLRENPPNILITNPDMLHNSFLGHADQWHKFFDGLKWIVVDEIHEYRGYFGSNVSMILRRFSHHLSQQNMHPQFFLSSATCANAGEHTHNLTGLSFAEINASNSIRPRRRFYFVQPNIPDHQYWDILQLRTVKAGLACLRSGKSVLAFCPTRRFAETCYPIVMREIDELHQSHIDPEAIKVFRSGLSTDERHDIQAGLKNGSVRLVFTTNALELGIDIGGLDGVILAGFPDGMMSAWQRIGRAGRNWKSEAFVLYYARNNPLDRFYASNLDMFLKKPLDDLVVNPGNEDLIGKHVPSLLFETDNLDGGSDILGQALYSAAVDKKKHGARPVRSGKWRPHSTVDIRGGGSGSFKLQHESKTIGTLSGQQQFREAYERAIYMHGGRKYRVEGISLTGSGGEITLGPVEQNLKTNAAMFTTIAEQEIYDGKLWASGNTKVSAYYGKALITEAINSIEEVDDRTGGVIDRWQPQINSAKFGNAHAFWICQEAESDETTPGVTALQHLLRVGAVFSIPLDAHDIFPHAVAKDRKAYIVESYPGGIGIARKVLDRWQSILETGIKVAESCSCGRGCPNCIVPPRSREELDKIAGISLARSLLNSTKNPCDFKFVNNLWEPVGT